jgi:hypothetical protein
MPINSYKMGPGLFTLGAADLDISCQLSQFTVTPSENIESSDAVPMLCGDDLPSEDEVTLSYVVGGTILQDLAAGGVVDYTWVHASDEVEFTFTPNTVLGATVTGVVRVIPLIIGGEVKSRPTSDFTWVVIGTPVFAP